MLQQIKRKGPTPLLSIASIILSMLLMAFGSGMMFAYIPFTLAINGYPAWVAGSAVTSIAAGGVIGCLVAGPIIRRVGHARAFACFTALVIFSAAAIATGVDPYRWLAARFIYGLAINGSFIVTQSWLNHSSDNSWRGKAMSVFYMTYVVGAGAGSFLFGFLPENGALAPVLAIMFATLGILPIGLTRLESPPPPEGVDINLAMTWKISPVGLVCIFAAGGLSMLVQGFTPIYAAASGLEQKEIGLLMFLMQLGMLVVQLPLGALSDRTDRRYVLAGTCIAVYIIATCAAVLPLMSLILMALVFALWAGATETIYSVASAHANDRASADEYVPLASTMLVAWSAAAFLLPAIVTAITPIFGPKAFMHAVILMALLTAGFVIVRLTQRSAVPDELSENFEFKSAALPNAEVLVGADEKTHRTSA
jgi:MFS family permease